MKLKKELGLLDVFAISTGAMFSSGFFMLPGLASQHTGPSVILAYLVAGILILPAMFSIAEISTALPRSGGAYFFLDRSLGPMIGTIGGIGTYVALLLKTAFALVGIGAYAALFFDIPLKETAVIFGVVFTVLNIFGAKKSSGIQKVFVVVLLLVLGAFVVDGIYHIFWADKGAGSFQIKTYEPFFAGGAEGFIFTVGFVFVSYLGLTQIASVAEEIKNPERNIPLGMALSLLVTTFIYVAGVFVMVSLIPGPELANDLAPAATAVQSLFTWLPPRTGLYIITIAALFAFASTGNAGMLSTSRFPLAMGRDKLFSHHFTKISRFGTPVPAILLTAGLIILGILLLSEEGIVKLASTFQLLIFMAINFSVIVFRNSRIASYDPGFYSPWFPWMQVLGIASSFLLISYMGWVPISLTAMVIGLALLWYMLVVRHKVKREGAIYHWFALLGKHQHDDLESEFLSILREKGLRQEDPFNQTLVRAQITTLSGEMNLKDVAKQVAGKISGKMGIDNKLIRKEFLKSNPFDSTLIIPEVLIFNAQIPGAEHPVLYIVRAPNGIRHTLVKNNITCHNTAKVLFFLLNDSEQTKQQLRMLTGIWDIAERDYFVQDFLALEEQKEMIEYLLHSKQYITFKLLANNKSAELIGKKLMHIKLPPDVLVILVERGRQSFAPHGNTVFKEGDMLTIIGETSSINSLLTRYVLEDEKS